MRVRNLDSASTEVMGGVRGWEVMVVVMVVWEEVREVILCMGYGRLGIGREGMRRINCKALPEGGKL